MTEEPRIRCKLEGFLSLVERFPRWAVHFESVAITDKEPAGDRNGRAWWVFRKMPVFRLGRHELPENLSPYFQGDVVTAIGPWFAVVWSLELVLRRYARDAASRATLEAFWKRNKKKRAKARRRRK